MQGEAALTVGVEEGAEKGGGEAVDGGSPVESGSTKLYFGNLPYSVDSPQLAAIVQDYGVAELIEVHCLQSSLISFYMEFSYMISLSLMA